MPIWPQPLLSVRDVEVSSAWYQAVLGATSGQRGEYEQLLVGDELILQLRVLAGPDATLGAGVLVWFEVDDFDGAVERVRAAGATVVTEPHVNPDAEQHEVWLRDPDGYTVVLAGPSEHRPRPRMAVWL